MDTGTPEAAPALPQAAPAPAAYVSATRPNWREGLLLGGLALGVLVALGLPWLLISVYNSSGLDFDTWKPLQPGAALQSFLPPGATDYTETTTGVIATYGNGVWAKVDLYDSPAQAQAAWRQRWRGAAWPPGVANAATETAAGQWVAYAQTGDGRLIEWVNAKCTFQIFAPTDRGLSDLIIASPLIDAPPERGFGHGMMPLSARLLRGHPALLASLLDLVMLAVLLGVFWLRLYLLRVKPPAGTARAGRETLRNRLRELNNANAPFVIEEQGPYHFACRWKVDDPVHGPWLARCNLRRAYQLDLYLEEGGTAGALETTGRLDWAPAGPGTAPRLSWNYLRSVASGAPGAPDAGPDSLTLPMQSHSAADYRRVLQQLVLGSGWVWKPLLFRPVVWEYK
jgi:hypothetical protein